jgi:hypothetical protein
MSNSMSADNLLDRYLRRALESLEEPLVQLVFLASLRDPYTGLYFHEGWATVSSVEAVHATLTNTHRHVFESVLNLRLPNLYSALRKHFYSLGERESTIAKLWLEMEPFNEMIPAGCSPLTRRFFISQVHFALKVLIRAPSLANWGGPTSSPLLQLGRQPRPH